MPETLPTTGNKMRGKLYAYGETAAILDVTNGEVLDIQRRLWQIKALIESQHSLKGKILEVVLGNNNLTVVFDPLHLSFDAVSKALKRYWQEEDNNEQSKRDPKRVNIRAVFGGQEGPDLDTLAASKSITPEALVEQYCTATYHVLFIGFQAGFPYLHGLPKELHAERHSNPRKTLAAGSIAIGGAQTGIYPNSSPGGWQIIGRVCESESPLFDTTVEPPNRFSPTDEIRFIPTEVKTN